MSVTDRYRTKLDAGEGAIAALCTVSDLNIAEILAVHFDMVMVDLQHGAAGLDRLHSLVLAIERHDAAAFVRVGWNQPQDIMRALDLGATGIIVPMIETAEQARHAAVATRYPPLGTRSFGPMRPGSLTTTEANRTVQCFPLVETVTGMQNLTEILDVEGVDGVYVGVGDLAISMGIGIAETYRSDAIAASVAAAVSAARERGKLVVTSAPDPEFADGLFDSGVDCVIVGLDKAMFIAGARAASIPRAAPDRRRHSPNDS